MRLFHVLNLTAGISVLIIGANLILYGSIIIVEPNPLILATEVVLAVVTIALNIREVRHRE